MEEDQALKELRAILLSAPHGLTSREVHKDFLSFVGTHLPYKQFGFSTLEAYLYSKPAIVRRSQENGQVIFRAVPDESTAHIAKMVSRQKTKKPKSRMVTPQSGKTHASGHFGHAPSPGTSSGNLRPNLPRKEGNKVPHEIQRKISMVLQKYSHGIPSPKFPHLYRNVHQVDLHSKQLGFRDLYQLLQTVPEIARIEHGTGLDTFMVFPSLTTAGSEFRSTQSSNGTSAGGRNDSIKTALTGYRQAMTVGADLKQEIRQILKQRPNGLWSARFPLEYEGYFNRPFPYDFLGYSSVVELLSALPDVCKVERPTTTSDFLITLTKSQDGDENRDGCPQLEQYIGDLSGTSSMSHSVPNRHVPMSNRLLDDVTRGRLLELVESRMPRGLDASDVVFAYERKYEEPLDMRRLGFHDAVALFSVLADHVTMEASPYSCMVRLKNAHTAPARRTPARPVTTIAEPSNSKDSSLTSPHSTSPASQRRGRQHQQQQQQQESQAQQLPYQYLQQSQQQSQQQQQQKQQQQQQSQAQQLPYQYPQQSQQQSLQQQQQKQQQQQQQQSRQPQQTQQLTHQPHSETCSVSRPASDRRHHSDYTETARATEYPHGGHPRDSYRVLELPHNITTRNCSIIVTHLVSPGQFYLQLVDEKMTGRLQAIANDINTLFDGRNSVNYTLSNPTLDCPCAALFDDGYWYRAMVRSKLPDGRYAVYFVDYGNESTVASSCLRSLRDDMMDLPAQAIQCCLHDNKPDAGDQKWSQLASAIFQKEVSLNDTLLARVVCNTSDGKIAITLYNGNGESINDKIAVATGGGSDDVTADGRASNTSKTSASRSIARGSTDMGGDQQQTPSVSSAGQVHHALRSLRLQQHTSSPQYMTSSSPSPRQHSGTAMPTNGTTITKVDDINLPPLGPMESSVDCAPRLPMESSVDSDPRMLVPPTPRGAAPRRYSSGGSRSSAGVTPQNDVSGYDTAADQSLDTLEDKIEVLETFIECSERGRDELYVNSPADTADRLDRVVHIARMRLDRLKQLVRDKRRGTLPSPYL